MQFLLGLIPVCVFLAALFLFDSYKLVPPRSLVVALGAGCVAACIAYPLNAFLMGSSGIGLSGFTRYVAPVVEESLKAAFLVYLLVTRRTGFLVDTAIQGFAIGAGFALVENISYVASLGSHSAILWLVRGFGTAMMHGAATSIAGIVGKVMSDRAGGAHAGTLLPGILLAIALHSAFNHFFIPAVASTMLIVLLLPVLMSIVFARSEEATRRWLGIGFDTDRELLEMISSGRLAETRIGEYLHALQSRFPGEVLADMLCLLRLRLELAVQAKGLLLMREAGFEIPPDTEVGDKFAELHYLRKSIGPTGMLVLQPFLHTPEEQLRQILRV
jgi:RsiW-degrading membrane proteinase PrsW (M82 family)